MTFLTVTSPRSQWFSPADNLFSFFMCAAEGGYRSIGSGSLLPASPFRTQAKGAPLWDMRFSWQRGKGERACENMRGFKKLPPRYGVLQCMYTPLAKSRHRARPDSGARESAESQRGPVGPAAMRGDV